MNTPVNVNIASDICSGYSLHFYTPPGAAYPITPAPSIEVPTRMRWQPGEDKSSHAMTTTVKHKGLRIVLAGHDCGWMIRDQALYLPWYLNGRNNDMFLASSRKVSFSASTVRMQGADTGLVSYTADLPILSCGEPVSIPLVKSDTSALNSVVVGATDADRCVGWFGIAMTMAGQAILYVINLVESAACGSMALKELKALSGFEKAEEAVLGNLFPSLPSAKDLIGVYVGVTNSAFASYKSGWTKPIEIGLSKSGSLGGVEVKVGYDPSRHAITYSESMLARNTKTTNKWSSKDPSSRTVERAGESLNAPPPGMKWDPEKGYVQS